MHTTNKKLYRSSTNKVFAGVMGGLGEYFDIDPVVFRAGYAAFTIFSALLPGVLAYLVMAAIIPRLRVHKSQEEVKHESVEKEG